VNCSLDDVDAVRPRLLRLLAPASTVMDLNIGAALWLATRACGTLHASAVAPLGKGVGASRDRGGSSRGSSRGDGREGEASLAVSPTATHSAAWAQDLNAACPLGPGAHAPPKPAPPQPAAGPAYTSQARVALLGHGADELCGGYARHATRFRAAGWEGLAAELAIDMRRMWLRNLGRDDRLVGDHGRWAVRLGEWVRVIFVWWEIGCSVYLYPAATAVVVFAAGCVFWCADDHCTQHVRVNRNQPRGWAFASEAPSTFALSPFPWPHAFREARHPFLDEAFVASVLEAPLPCVTDPREGLGVGDKRVLRACLHLLGLPRAAQRPKRAIQFGTRLAREANVRDFGGTRQANARKAGTVAVGSLGSGGGAVSAAYL
jgi:hypothetical protein